MLTSSHKSIANSAMIVAICFISALFFTGCREKNTTPALITDFPIEEVLEGVRFDPENGEYLLSYMIHSAGDYIICPTRHSKHLFAVYDRDFNLVDSLIVKGSGPGELTRAFYFGQWTGNPESPQILVFDPDTKRLLRFGVHPFTDIETVWRIPASEFLDPESVYLMNDSLIAGINLEIPKAAELFNCNPRNDSINIIPAQFEFQPKEAFYVSQCGLVPMGNGASYIVYYHVMPWIAIYGSDFNLIRKIAIGSEVDPYSLTANDMHQSFITGAAISDNNVAILQPSAMTENEDITDAYLMVLDSEGNPVARFVVGKAMWFTVGRARRNIITVNYDLEADHVYFMVYPIPDNLR